MNISMFTNLFQKAKADKNELIWHHQLGDTKKKNFWSFLRWTNSLFREGHGSPCELHTSADLAVLINQKPLLNFQYECV